MEPGLLSAIRAAIHSATGCDIGPACEARAVSGGCIHRAFVLRAATPFFVKVDHAANIDMFVAEKEGLHAIGATGTLRVPRAIVAGTSVDSSFLVLECLAMQSGSAKDWQPLGEQLAALHRCTSADGRFGWSHDNHIGATPQPNGWQEDWIHFWREARLGYQLKIAADKGVRFEGSDRLLERLDAFFTGHRPAASLLHGDLWSGNVAFTSTGEPVVFDPACYYGDRECDLAFTSLFGGFPQAFYDAYDAAWRRADGWRSRHDLYNLYHVLNHFHLFGGSYREQAQQMIHSLNAQM